MKPLTLADEIAEAMPEILRGIDNGPLARDIAEHIGADVPAVRRAMEALDADGRAKIIRRGRALHLVPSDYPGRICVICRAEFQPVAKRTKTCSHSCALHLAWQNPDMRRRHQASVKASRTPELRAKSSIVNRERCSKPEVRRQLSEQNKRAWRDPEIRVRRLLSIKEAWRGEKAAPRRDRQRQKKLRLWSDPEWRAKTIEAMRTGVRGKSKRAVLRLVAKNFGADEIATRAGLSIKQVKIIWRRAYRLGEINRKPPDGRRRQARVSQVAA